MPKPDVTIVIIRAPGYSGATWINLVLGSHPQALAMGPPQRILNLPGEEIDAACFIHREACPFWPAFLRQRDHTGSFFRNLAQYSGRRVFVMNYPTEELVRREIDGQGFRLRHIKVVREGRANLHSYLRHHGLKRDDRLVRAMRQWLLPKWDQIDDEMPADPAAWTLLRYEDMVAAPHRELARLAPFVGLDDYPEDSHVFWRHEHHLTAGNTGVIDTLCRLNGLPGYGHHRKEAYDEIVDRLNREPELPVADESWREAFSYRDRLVFDVLAGARNAAYGYERDDFTPRQRSACLARLDRPDSGWTRLARRIRASLSRS